MVFKLRVTGNNPTQSLKTMLNISILGASNSILKNGYVPRVQEALKALGVECSIENFSVGATSCLRGMVPLLAGDIPRSDVIILEYSITDMPYLTEVGESVWRASYEGLVRTAALTHPESHIVCLILGRSQEKFFARQDIMRKNIHDIASKYNVSVVDFDAELRSLLPDVEEFEMCYKDMAHYQPPLPTSLCAASIAKEIYRRLGSSAVVDTTTANVFDEAKVIKFPENFGQYKEIKTFENSRLKVITLRLRLGESIELPAGIRPLGLEFVSWTDSCNIKIHRGENFQILHSLHGKVKTKQFSFLWRFMHTQADDWEERSLDNWMITAVSSAETKPTLFQYGMIANEPKHEKAAYLSRLIYY